jgi:hypothetical protein
MARVALSPTNQSASVRQRAAASRLRMVPPSRSLAKPARMALSVMLEIHRRCTGASQPASS